ncbi:hypothetical protein BDV11DRAFT_211615 [Aspergillus similis]
MLLTQYTKAVRDTWQSLKDNDPLPADFMQESVAAGLCTGMLAAMAVSHSGTLQSLATNSGIAVRQAMAIGALVDAEMAADGSDRRAVSFSVSWGAGCTLENVESLIQPFSNKLAAALAQALKDAGVYVARLELAGRFHWQGHAENTKILAQLLASNEKFHLSSSRRMMFYSEMSSLSRASPVEVTLVGSFLFDASQGRIISIWPERCVPPTFASLLNSRVTQIGETSLAKIGISYQASHHEDQIAVVGMSCHVPGAEDLEEFWNILVGGQSQHREVPLERFPIGMNWRKLQEHGTTGRKWFGNFIDDFDKFDHKFFKKSPRESASMDPQQRLCLKLAYQAMEQAGYFTTPTFTDDKHIGCYIGVGNVDYIDNISCHPANAYTATGNFRSFVAGKVSHWFGWTGPSLTVDTACSSSSVAIHQVCLAILHGECRSALAGGVNIFTSLNWFHNLAGASFLSPTGQCKPFDASADGYCRGEGGCAVFGVIAATKVYQNQNCTAITVPNSPSLSELFYDVLKQARLEPQHVSVVEAHGTPVGDPAEYAAVRTVFGGHSRGNTNLSLMSVKGLIGHAEFASGIISLVKILLMMHHRTIPPQPCFPWDARFRAALINNYGASGSNASMIPSAKSNLIEGQIYPFRLYAFDQKSLKAYIRKLRLLIECQAAAGNVNNNVLTVSNLSFQLCRQSNPTLPWGAIFSASSLPDLCTNLFSLDNDSGLVVAEQFSPTTRPVILCFGGQVATILRAHLDKCDSASIQDICRLQLALFAMQYSCARSWIDCGVNVAAVCIAGVYSLNDALKIVSRRARIIRDSWSSERENLIAKAFDASSGESDVGIACHNGPKSCTLAGSARWIDHFQSMKLLKPLMKELRDVAADIELHAPTIRLLSDFVAQHLRHPNYANAIWLEAGSNSAIANMASRSLGSPASSHFQAINITSNNSLAFLVDNTLELWKQGLNVAFWMHHASQVQQYSPLILPPYQFEKATHWIELKDMPLSLPFAATEKDFVAYQEENKQNARFWVNVGTSHFQVPGNATKIAHKIALHAIYSLHPDLDNTAYQPIIRNTHLHTVLCADINNDLFIDVVRSEMPDRAYTWKITSVDSSGAPSTVYSTGIISFTSSADPYVKETYDHLTRLSGRGRCEALLNGTDENVDVLQGRSIYRSMQHLIEYKEPTGGVTKVSSNGSEAAGRVKGGYVNAIRTETFCQVANNQGTIFICRGFSQWLRSCRLSDNDIHSREWTVFAACHRASKSAYIVDMFVFDRRDGNLTEIMLGGFYEQQAIGDIVTGQLVAEASLEEISSSSSTDIPTPADAPSNNPASNTSHNGLLSTSADSGPTTTSAFPANAAVDAEVYNKTVELVCNLSGLEPQDIENDSGLAEIGIDSLMAMEVVREVDATFHVVLTNDALMELTDFKSLVACIRSALGMRNDTAPVKEPAAPSTSNDILDRQINDTSSMEPVSDVNGAAGRAEDGYNCMPNGSPATLLSPIILEVFNELAWETDNLLEEHNLAGYNKHITPRTSELCLGCSIRSAKAGDQLARVPYLAKHEKLMRLMYQLLEVDARLINIRGSTITRTAVAPPLKSADTLLAKLLDEEPTHIFADLITGREDGLQVIFGRQESHGVASDFYAKSPFTGVWIHQLSLFMERLISRIPKTSETISILEIGAGTGGTTSQLVPLLARLGVPIRYTMSDISGSLVAAARKRVKIYSFVEFRVLDVESAPDAALVQSQHIVLATNCIHATRNLSVSLANIHRMLRTDGLLMLLEMTHRVPWIDFVFGLLEGWWLFEDERDYVLAPVSHWENTLRSVGFGHVDWTRGDHPEADLQRLIIAFPSKDGYPQAPRPSAYVSRVFTPSLPTNNAERQKINDNYVEKYSKDFELPESISSGSKATSTGSWRCVLVTGATGSLGSHIVAAIAQRSDVERVICVNRLSNTEANIRQNSSFAMRGIGLDDALMAKLEVIETDTSKASIGLSADKYQSLIGRVTHIVHSAWPMSLTRPIRMYESQMKILRNLISLAADIAVEQPQLRVGFLFVSSIAVVGNYPLWKGTPLVPEQPTTVESVPLTGYAEAKLVCETVLSKTLRRYPDRFQAKAVRIAQISGSTTNGYWNSSEYMPFLIKTSQSLGILPYLEGTLSWYPVDGVAAALGELLFSKAADDLIYHIDNPSRQNWQDMMASLASALGLGKESIVPYDQWVDRVRRLRGSTADNPALQLIDFFETYFIPMSCGELILDTTRAKQYSETLRNQGPITDEVIGKYIRALRSSGFLE